MVQKWVRPIKKTGVCTIFCTKFFHKSLTPLFYFFWTHFYEAEDSFHIANFDEVVRSGRPPIGTGRSEPQEVKLKPETNSKRHSRGFALGSVRYIDFNYYNLFFYLLIFPYGRFFLMVPNFRHHEIFEPNKENEQNFGQNRYEQR